MAANVVEFLLDWRLLLAERMLHEHPVWQQGAGEAGTPEVRERHKKDGHMFIACDWE